MERKTFGNRPTKIAARVRIEDFLSDKTTPTRVSLKLRESDSSDRLIIDAQAFQVTDTGRFVAGPDGRPSRTPGTAHTIATSALGDTHTLHPGWVRIVGDYDHTTFEPTATRGPGVPVDPPDLIANPTGQHYDTDTGTGYRWDEGEVLRIAKSKVEELDRILANSAPISGIDF